MKHLFIINPAAGKRENTRRLEADIRGLEWDWEIAYTAKSGDACRYARAAAEAHGGTIRAECRNHSSLLFHVTLPVMFKEK